MEQRLWRIEEELKILSGRVEKLEKALVKVAAEAEEAHKKAKRHN